VGITSGAGGGAGGVATIGAGAGAFSTPVAFLLALMDCDAPEGALRAVVAGADGEGTGETDGLDADGARVGLETAEPVELALVGLAFCVDDAKAILETATTATRAAMIAQGVRDRPMPARQRTRNCRSGDAGPRVLIRTSYCRRKVSTNRGESVRSPRYALCHG